LNKTKAGDVVINAAEELIRDLDGLISEEDLGKPSLSSVNYRVYPFDTAYFKKLLPTESERKIASIDGGNSELVGAPNFSIQLNRVFFNIFDGPKRITETIIPNRIEFFSTTFTTPDDGHIFYKTLIFPLSEVADVNFPSPNDLCFDSRDRRLMIGDSRAEISRVASIARRFAEWEYARQVVETEMDEGDLIVMDGTLRTAFQNESMYAKRAYKSAMRKGVIYSGFSKTCRLFTTTGLSLIGAVGKLAADAHVGPTWYYNPIAESLSPDHEGSIYIVKLHEQSPRTFRYEIQSEQDKNLDDEEIGEIFSQLYVNSSDVSFPGYPYGLIDADDNSRVRSEEKEMYRIIMLSEASKRGSWAKFSRHVQSTDAHNILNMLKEVSR
jgi:hypothetical protein